MKRLIVKDFGVVNFLKSTAKQFRGARLPCKLHYPLLGQAGFWIVLSFTGKGLCSFIPEKNLISGDKTQLTALELPTERSLLKFPIVPANAENFSRQAKDLAPIKNETPFALDSVPSRAASMPEQAETMGTTQKTILNSIVSPALPSNRCWKVPANCGYAVGSVRVGQAESPLAESRRDPELGDLQLSPVPEAELGILNLQPIATDPPAGANDPELGTLRIQERTTPQPPLELPSRPRQPTAYLLARADYFKSSNVFSDVDPVDDGLIRTGLTFFYAPPIGSRTFLITSIDANLIRYAQLGQFRDVNGDRRSLSYDELRFRAGVFHRITPRLSAELGWSNQKLFTSGRGLEQIYGGREFFGDNSIRFELSRQDALSPRLSLNTYYQFRWSFANPDDRSRILNSAIATLGYNFSRNLQTAIDYQFTWSHFTQQERDDLYHQLIARLTYNFTPRTQLNIFSGYSFGHSSDKRIDFNSFIFGAGLVISLPLF